ncbi:hypothetical protein FI667_g5518, partial [Globisporangium splendens]
MPKKSATAVDPSGRSSWLHTSTRQQHIARRDSDSKPHSSCHHTHLTDVHGLDSGSGLRGHDLVEQIAQNTKLQKLRWMEYAQTIYKRLWERKAKVDIADTILIVGAKVLLLEAKHHDAIRALGDAVDVVRLPHERHTRKVVTVEKLVARLLLDRNGVVETEREARDLGLVREGGDGFAQRDTAKDCLEEQQERKQHEELHIRTSFCIMRSYAD